MKLYEKFDFNSLKAKALFYCVVALLLFGFDFTLKYWVFHNISKPFVVFSTPFGINFSIDYATNCGGAWGMLSSFQIPLLIFRIIIVIILAWYFFLHRSICVVFIIIGALCNIFDNFYYGYVIDMLHFTFWGRSYGIFNLADGMIFIGAIGLLRSVSRSAPRVS